MNRFVTVALLGTLLSGTAFADQQGFYLGLGVGTGQAKASDIIIAVPQGTTNGDLDESETSFKLLGGYRFGRNFAIEATFQDFGEPDPFRTGIDDVDGNEILGNLEARSFQLAAVPSLSLADGAFDIFGRLGVSLVDEELRFTGTPPIAVPQQINTDREGTNPLLSYGLGVQFNLGQRRNFLIRAEWEQTLSDAVDRYDYLGLSVGYRFGGN